MWAAKMEGEGAKVRYTQYSAAKHSLCCTLCNSISATCHALLLHLYLYLYLITLPRAVHFIQSTRTHHVPGIMPLHADLLTYNKQNPPFTIPLLPKLTKILDFECRCGRRARHWGTHCWFWVPASMVARTLSPWPLRWLLFLFYSLLYLCLYSTLFSSLSLPSSLSLSLFFSFLPLHHLLSLF